MRQTQKHEIAVGLFVLVALALLFAMTFIIRGNTGMNPYTLKAEFANVTGLEIGSPVLVQGFRLGRVTEMAPGKNDDGQPTVVVFMKIARTIPIYNDAIATLAQQGFIGDKQIEINPGTVEAGEVNPGDYVASRPPLDMNQVFAKAGGVMDDLSESLGTLREFTTDQERLDRIDEIITNIHTSSEDMKTIIADNEQDVKDTVENVRLASERTLEVAERVDKVMKNTDERIERVGAQVEEAITEFRASSEDLTQKLDKILADADGVGENANDLLLSSRQEVEKVSASLQEVSENLNKILEQINAGEGTVGRLVQDPQPFDDLRDSVAALKSVLSEQKEEGFYDRQIEYQSEDAAPPTTGGEEN